MHKYKLLGRKGEGTFSEVLKAQSIKSGKYMAIKCMKHVFESIEQVNNLREIQALRRLSPHPNIVKLYEVLYDQPTGRLALVFELMDMNIYELIKGRTHYLPEETIKNYSYQILKAVDHMHRHGIFHRDIKPENLLIAENTLKLADFGSCRGIYSKQPYTEYISTRWYRAPECLLTDGYYGYKMDLWGVGCVLFETLALYPLFPGTNEADQIERIHKILGTPTAEVLDKFKKFGSSHVDFNFTQHKRHPMGLSKLLPHVSAEVVDLLQRMLIYDPDERITARDALRHPWFAELRAADRKAKEAAKLKKAAEEAATGGSGSGSGRPTPSPGLDGSSQASPDRSHGLSPSNDSTHEHSMEPKKLPDSSLAAAQGQHSNAMGLPAPKGTLVQQGKQGSSKVSAADSVGTGHQPAEQGTGGAGGKTGGHGQGRAAGAEVVSSKGGSGAGVQPGKEKSKRDPMAGYQLQGSRLIAGKEKEGEQGVGNASSQPQGGKLAETKSGKGGQGEKSSTFSSPAAAVGRSSGAGAGSTSSTAHEGGSKLNAGNSMYSLPNNGSTMAGGPSGAVLSPYAGASGVGGPSAAGSGSKGMKYAPASSLVAAAKNELSQSSVYGGGAAMQGMYSPHASMMAGSGQAQAGQGQGQGMAGSPLPQGSPSTLQVLAGLASGTKAAAGGPRRLDPLGAASVAGSSPSVLGSYGGGAGAAQHQQPALYSLSNGPAGRSNGQTTVVLSQARQGAGATRLPASMLMPPTMPGQMPVMQALSPAGSGSSMPGPASSPVQQQQQQGAYNNPYANYSTGLLNSGKKGGVLSPLGAAPGAQGVAGGGQGGMTGRYQGGVAAGASLYGSPSVPGLSDSSLMPGMSGNSGALSSSPAQPILPNKSKGPSMGGLAADTSGTKQQQQQQQGGAFSIEQPTKAGGHLGAAMAKQQVQAARGEGAPGRAAPAPQPAIGQRQAAAHATGKQKAGMTSDFYISGMTSKTGKQSSAMLSPGGGVPSGQPLWSSPVQQQQQQGGMVLGYGGQHGSAAAAAAAGRGLVAGMSPAVAGAVARNLAGSPVGPVGMGGWSDPLRSHAQAQAQAQALGGRGMMLSPLGGGPSRAPVQSMPSYGSPAGNIGPHALYTNGATGGNLAGGSSSLYSSGAAGAGQGAGAARTGLAGAGSLAGNLLLAGGVQSGPAAAYGSPANLNFRWGNRDRSTRRLGGGAGGGPGAAPIGGQGGAQPAGGQGGGAGRRSSSDKGIPTKAELQQYQSPYAQKSSLGY